MGETLNACSESVSRSSPRMSCLPFNRTRIIASATGTVPNMHDLRLACDPAGISSIHHWSFGIVTIRFSGLTPRWSWGLVARARGAGFMCCRVVDWIVEGRVPPNAMAALARLFTVYLPPPIRYWQHNTDLFGCPSLNGLSSAYCLAT